MVKEHAGISQAFTYFRFIKDRALFGRTGQEG
jgi:hypothetical protein